MRAGAYLWRAAGLAALLLTMGVSMAGAQALSTARQTLELSAFGGATGTYTGLSNGRNAAITAGFDVGFLPLVRFGGLDPTVEVRGTFPVVSGGVDGQESVLVGGKLGKAFRKYHLYGDILVGRGETTYQGYGYPQVNTSLYYTKSAGMVLSPGFGVDIDITPRFALKLDGQYQRFSVPVTASGSVYAKQGTVGMVYRFPFRRLQHLAQ